MGHPRVIRRCAAPAPCASEEARANDIGARALPNRGMECGLAVSLDPHGGNEVNFRAVLRAATLKWGKGRADHDEDEAEGSDASDTEPTTNPAPRARIANDYDYDDDFIDDDELYREQDFVDDSRAPPPISVDEGPPAFDPDAPIARDKPLPVVKPVDPAFYVNRGEIRARSKMETLVRRARMQTRSKQDVPPKPVQSTASATATLKPTGPNTAPENATPATKGTKNTAKGKEASKPRAATKSKAGTGKNGASAKSETKAKGKKVATDKKSATPAKRPLKQQSVLTPSGKLAKSSSAPSGPVSAAVAVAAVAGGENATKKRKTENPAPKPVPPVVLTEVEKVRKLCLSMFGDKKPKLTDATVQTQLHLLFNCASSNGCARLYSDIHKDNRRFVITDEFWATLKFLRTTRQYFEQLGHALHWGANEKTAAVELETASNAVENVAKGEGGKAFSSDTITPEMEQVLTQYLIARSKQLHARNQLAARSKSTRKAMPSWAQALKKGAMSSCGVEEDKILDALKKMDEKETARVKKKREEEKEARKKKKEEAAALPKQMAAALPPALRNLASLKAKAGATGKKNNAQNRARE